jgi:N-formylmaleamate deformylase
MSTWQSDFVSVQGTRLHYTRTGGGKPPIVLAHGVTDNGLCWTPVAAALAADYDVIMVDARGHGYSDAPASGYDSATQAGDLAGVITGLQLDKPVVIGHSMGAMTTLQLAGQYPDLPRAIILEDPPGHWLPVAANTTADVERMAGLRAWFLGVKQKTREELIAEQRSGPNPWQEAEFSPWADAKHQVSEQVFGIFAPGGSVVVDWATTLPKISCPALVLTADPTLGAVLSDAGVAALKLAVPQLQVSHIAGAGHNIRREQFAIFMETVRGFLASVR